MQQLRSHPLLGAFTLALGTCVLMSALPAADADTVPREVRRSFRFPISLADGVTGDLVTPPGSSGTLNFTRGKVAIGKLPVPLPASAARRRRGRTRQFLLPSDGTPHARLLLKGVVDGDGVPVNNEGNELVIDAVVSPNTAATSAPPFVFRFEINDGTAFVDAPLPIDTQSDRPVRVQILGARVLTPDGEPFGVLGFELPAGLPPPAPRATPTPDGQADFTGQCFVSPDCVGPSFAASQERCCRLASINPRASVRSSTSWCPPERFDRATGQCAAAACFACRGATPTPVACADRAVCTGPCVVRCPDGRVEEGTCQEDAACACTASCEVPPPPEPGGCGDASTCGGLCRLDCRDGTTAVGECIRTATGRCQCSALCSEPTPCTIGQCFDTITFRCTGQPCGPGLQCPLTNQFCDQTGRRCPCRSVHPPPPHGRICCECADAEPACFEVSFVEVDPICPHGCETFLDAECDPVTETCVQSTGPGPRP